MNLMLLDIKQDFERIRTIWGKLAQSSTPSYFLSWGWIENWISFLPTNAAVQLAVFVEGEQPVAAFFLGQTALVRHNAIRSRGMFLNATGIPLVDRVHIEYNAILHSSSRLFSLHELLALLPDHWDEFWMPGLDANAFPGNMLEQTTSLGEIQIERDVPSPYVDLELVRQKDGNYLSLLSSHMRAHVKRSQRAYESRGPISLEAACNPNMALEIFDEMVSMHQKAWQAKGQEGAFASNFMRQFHRALICKRFEYGEIQLLRIKVGNTIIGCLYDFVYNGKVYSYQSGFHFEMDNRLTPGYVSLVEAIKYCAALGLTHFDFMGSDAAYKQRLCTHQQRLIWAKVQKPRLQFQLETGLKALKQSLQSLRR
ncbi:MAG: GNAT family N-acetyltransferase [Caldilineaceae bacterium]|nr:GNAT family N-acetyltransferase [Caldilineaceae bacterium]